MSNSGLGFVVADPQAAHGFADEIVEFIGVCAAADPPDAFAPVDRAAGGVPFDKSVVARFLDPMSDLINGGVPGDVVPVIRPRAANLRDQQPALVADVLLERSSLWTQSAAVNGMVRVALNMDHLGRHIFGFVANGVNDDAATYRTIWTGRSRFRGTVNLELAKLRVYRRQVETEQPCTDSSQGRYLKEFPTGRIHNAPHYRSERSVSVGGCLRPGRIKSKELGQQLASVQASVPAGTFVKSPAEQSAPQPLRGLAVDQ